MSMALHRRAVHHNRCQRSVTLVVQSLCSQRWRCTFIAGRISNFVLTFRKMQTMKFHFDFFWAVALFVVVFGDLGEAEVVHLTDSDFEQTIQERDLVLVNFYISEGCDTCDALAPEYSAAASILKDSKPDVILADIDCHAVGEVICKAYNINQYPMVIGFRQGEKAFLYNGQETSSDIVEYILSQPDPLITELPNLQELDNYLQELDPSVIGFFQDLETEEALVFGKAASLLSDRYRFALCQSEEILSEYGFRNDIVIFRSELLANKLEPSQLKYTGEPLASSLIPWIKSNIFGLAGLRTRDNMDKFDKPLVVVYFDINFMKKPKQTEFWRIRILKVAQNISAEGSGLTFALSNAYDFDDELAEYKLTYDDEKPVVAARDIFDQKFVMREDFTIERLRKFAEDLTYGHLKPYLKSQEIPQDNNGPVKVVVADTFDLIVNDPRQDVFIELYDPMSPRCQDLAPLYQELAEELREEYAIVIAKMDAVGNELPLNYRVNEFPTFYFARKRSKAEPLLYDGEHTVSDFMKFIAQKASYPLRTFDMDGKKRTEKSEL